MLVHMKPIGGKVIYYTGFGWKKNGQFSGEEEWINYLQGFSDRLSAPLKVEINPE